MVRQRGRGDGRGMHGVLRSDAILGLGFVRESNLQGTGQGGRAGVGDGDGVCLLLLVDDSLVVLDGTWKYRMSILVTADKDGSEEAAGDFKRLDDGQPTVELGTTGQMT